MARLIITRLLTLIPLMFFITSVVFFLIHFIPGDPARVIVGGQRITEANLQNIRHQYRLDKPVIEQYGLWVKISREEISADRTGNEPRSERSSSTGWR